MITPDQILVTPQFMVVHPMSPPKDGDDGAVEEALFELSLERLYSEGVRVFVIGNATSGHYTLTPQEIILLATIASRTVGLKEGVQIWVGVGAKLVDAKVIAKGVKDLPGVVGGLVMTLYGPYLDTEGSGQLDYFRDLALAVPDFAFALYWRNEQITMDGIDSLLDLPNFVMLKLAQGNGEFCLEVVSRFGDRLFIAEGRAENFAAESMIKGKARTFTTGSGNLCPKVALEIHRRLANGDRAGAQVYLTVMKLMEDWRALHDTGNNGVALNAAMEVVHPGWPTYMRPTMRRFNDAEITHSRLIAGVMRGVEATL